MYLRVIFADIAEILILKDALVFLFVPLGSSTPLLFLFSPPGSTSWRKAEGKRPMAMSIFFPFFFFPLGGPFPFFFLFYFILPVLMIDRSSYFGIESASTSCPFSFPFSPCGKKKGSTADYCFFSPRQSLFSSPFPPSPSLYPLLKSRLDRGVNAGDGGPGSLLPFSPLPPLGLSLFLFSPPPFPSPSSLCLSCGRPGITVREAPPFPFFPPLLFFFPFFLVARLDCIVPPKKNAGVLLPSFLPSFFPSGLLFPPPSSFFPPFLLIYWLFRPAADICCCKYQVWQKMWT